MVDLSFQFVMLVRWPGRVYVCMSMCVHIYVYVRKCCAKPWCLWIGKDSPFQWLGRYPEHRKWQFPQSSKFGIPLWRICPAHLIPVFYVLWNVPKFVPIFWWYPHGRWLLRLKKTMFFGDIPIVDGYSKNDMNNPNASLYWDSIVANITLIYPDISLYKYILYINMGHIHISLYIDYSHCWIYSNREKIQKRSNLSLYFGM